MHSLPNPVVMTPINSLGWGAPPGEARGCQSSTQPGAHHRPRRHVLTPYVSSQTAATGGSNQVLCACCQNNASAGWVTRCHPGVLSHCLTTTHTPQLVPSVPHKVRTHLGPQRMPGPSPCCHKPHCKWRHTCHSPAFTHPHTALGGYTPSAVAAAGGARWRPNRHVLVAPFACT